jgi:nitrogen fixation protein FixH
MKRHAWIIGPALVGLITSSMLVGAAALIYHAHADPSVAVESDYYDKAVHWDDLAAQKQRSAALGWRLIIDTSSGSSLRLTLVDGIGVPIEGAIVTVEAFHNARSGDRLQLAPVGAGGGVYEQAAAFDRPGLWEFRVIARRESDTFTVVQQRMVAAGDGAAP